ncbi:MAG: LuxR family transcriptional regulator [Xanthomonadales bacterium]|nr:LuxR family transcriptional regulator [Xanthomonadales bacterium]
MLKQWDNLQHLLECTSAPHLRTVASRHVQQLGFDNWIYSSGAEPRDVGDGLVTYPPEWLSLYRRRGYFAVDPVVDHCRQHITPCLWAADPAARGAGYQTRFFAEAIDFGLRAGIGLPIHGPLGHSGMLSVAMADSADAGTHLHQLGELQLLATFIHEAQIRLSSRTANAQVHLTARELDCLRWAAEGKTSWAIGQQLGISERTAIFHLSNSARKLGVIGRRQAIARAMSLNLIAI